MPSTGFRRRADLSGVFRISDRSVLVVAADASGPVKDGVGAVGVDVDADSWRSRPPKRGDVARRNGMMPPTKTR